MTQDPQNPEEPRPPETPPSAWAPRPETPAPDEPEPSLDTALTTESRETAQPSDAESPAPAEPASTTPGTGWGPVTPAGATAGGVATPPQQQPATARPRSGGVPLWLMLASVVVAATLAGLAVYFFTGDDGDSGGDVTEAASIIDGLMRLGQPDQSNISSFSGQLPPDFPPEFPMYADAEIVVANSIATEQGTAYLVVLSTEAPTSDVYNFYNDSLDQEPWQVELGRSSADFTGLRFLRPDNIDVSGSVSLHRSQLEERTVIYVSYNDISQAVVPGDPAAPFALGPTRPLPAGFPDDIPIYEGAEETVILDTYFERGQGGRAFIVTFLTKDSQDQVIEFYREEFEGRGWVVSDAGVSSTSFALAIEFDDGPSQSVSGSISADSFEEDPAYTQVDLLVTTSGNRAN